MEDRGICGLAQAADSALVDVPASGSYYDHYRGIPAVNYAVELAETHPRTRVVSAHLLTRLSEERSCRTPNF